MLRKKTPRMQDIQTRVMPAFLLRGWRKAVMPLEMASMPVIAEVPLEKACSSRKGVTVPSAPSIEKTGGFTTVPSEPVSRRSKPNPTVRNIITTKK
jgi:hypothetical protein